MRSYLKAALKTGAQKVVKFFGKTNSGHSFFELIQGEMMNCTQVVQHKDVQLKFMTPNALNKFRVDTFSTKEPETLAWIDDMPDGAVVWDIGANIGLYTCYAAKARIVN